MLKMKTGKLHCIFLSRIYGKRCGMLARGTTETNMKPGIIPKFGRTGSSRPA
jgi:hypothetical protein